MLRTAATTRCSTSRQLRAGVAVRAAVRTAITLPDGTLVRFRTINQIDGTLSAAVPGRASGKYWRRISELTYLVISRPDP